MDVTDLSGTGLSLNLNAVVYNPNDFGVTLDAVNYSIYGSGRYLGNGQTAREYSLDPHSSQTLTFPVSVSWRPIFQTMGNYVVEWGNVTWEVNGTANIKVAGLPLSVPFKFTTG